jgi:hypothetical protein
VAQLVPSVAQRANARCFVFGRLMVRLFYIVGISSLLASCGVFGLCVRQWSSYDPTAKEFLASPTAIERFQEIHSPLNDAVEKETPPLVVQARLLALCLEPPSPAVMGRRDEAPGARDAGTAAPPAPILRPPAPSVTFKLHGTSYYPNQPDRSMALISETGYGVGEERWVKEGMQLGHFVIHEIRKGMIVYRDGEQLREMAVEHGASVPSIVRDARSGSRKVSTAVDDAGIMAPALAGPNSIRIGGD